MSDTNKKEDIGALWARTSRSGLDFLSGKIKVDGKEISIIAFANTYKKPGDSAPDWRVYPSEDRPQQGGAPQGRKPAPAAKPKAAPQTDNGDVGEDDIPF